MDNVELMALARAHLRGNWDIMAGTFLIYLVITGILSVVPVLGLLAGLLVSGPLLVGLHILALSTIRDREIALAQLFDGFTFFTLSMFTYLLMLLFICLWTLLLIIPGLLAMLSYSMTFFILADDHAIDPREAIRKSKELMAGHRWKLSCLAGRFTGWFLLGILTLGVGFIWIGPYFMTTMALFYDDIRKNEQPMQNHSLQVIPGS
jgi:uncharacterized membrane protein